MIPIPIDPAIITHGLEFLSNQVVNGIPQWLWQGIAANTTFELTRAGLKKIITNPITAMSILSTAINKAKLKDLKLEDLLNAFAHSSSNQEFCEVLEKELKLKEDECKVLYETLQKAFLEYAKKDEEIFKEFADKIEQKIEQINEEDRAELKKELNKFGNDHKAFLNEFFDNLIENIDKDLKKVLEKIEEMREEVKKIRAILEKRKISEESELIEVEGSKDEFEDKKPASPEFCYGREEEVKVFEDFLKNQEKIGFLVRGKSGIGKSSYVLKLSEKIEVFLAVDCRGYNGPDFFKKVIEGFKTKVIEQSKNFKVSKVDRCPYCGCKEIPTGWTMCPICQRIIVLTYASIEDEINKIAIPENPEEQRYALTKIEKVLKSASATGVIFLDQFETLAEFGEALHIVNTWLISLKHEQKRSNLVIGISTRPELFTLPQERWIKIMQNSKELYLEGIKEDAVKKILEALDKKLEELSYGT